MSRASTSKVEGVVYDWDNMGKPAGELSVCRFTPSALQASATQVTIKTEIHATLDLETTQDYSEYLQSLGLPTLLA